MRHRRCLSHPGRARRCGTVTSEFRIADGQPGEVTMALRYADRHPAGHLRGHPRLDGAAGGSAAAGLPGAGRRGRAALAAGPGWRGPATLSHACRNCRGGLRRWSGGVERSSLWIGVRGGRAVGFIRSLRIACPPSLIRVGARRLATAAITASVQHDDNRPDGGMLLGNSAERNSPAR